MKIEQSFEFAVSTGFFIYENDWGIEMLRNLENSAVRYVEIYWGHLDHSGLKPVWKDGLYDDPNKGIIEMIQVLDDIGIPCWSLHVPHSAEYDPSSTSTRIRQQTEDSLHRCLEHLHRLKGKILVVHPGVEPISGEERPARMDGAIKMLKRLSSECEAAGLQLALENLPRSNLANSVEEMQYFLENINSPAAGVNFDFAHAFVTEGVCEMIEPIGRSIINVHICDNTLPNEERTCWPMESGKGLINWRSALCALKRASYQGPAMYEVYAPRGESVQAIKRLEDNYAQLRKIWDSC